MDSKTDTNRGTPARLADTAEGIMLGLACGDALGRPVEFRSAESIEREYGRLEEMVGNGTYGKPPGTITDDTEMALCIARSLVERGTFDGADVADRFLEWYDSGPFDIGLMTADSLRKIRRGGSWKTAGRSVWETRPEGQNAGNGSVMRCAPYAIAFHSDQDQLVDVSKQSAAITHADSRCTYGNAVLTLTIANILHEEPKPLERALEYLGDDVPLELADALESIRDRRPEDLRSSGYVLHTLETALHVGLCADDPADAIVDVVGMGNDTDTVGAVTGAIVGARFGASALPDEWIDELEVGVELRQLATDLLEVDTNGEWGGQSE